MSCEYGYHCKTCNVSSETWLNHGQDILSAYAHYWPIIQQMHNTSNGYLEVNIMGHNYMSGIIWEFMEKHHKHDIELADEYEKHEPLKVKQEDNETLEAMIRRVVAEELARVFPEEEQEEEKVVESPFIGRD